MVNASELLICDVYRDTFATTFRFMFVVVAGTFIAIISIMENLVLFYVFSTSRKLRRQNYANPVLLALFDIVVALCYVSLIATHSLALTVNSSLIYRCWTSYMRIVYCVQNIASTIANFLLVVASLERYLANSTKKASKSILITMVKHKLYVIVTICTLSFIFKATLYIETPVFELKQCPVLKSVLPIWVQHNTINDPLRFWIRKLCTVIIPFVILAFCNFRIVVELRQRRREWKEMLKQFCRKKINATQDDNGSGLCQQKYPRGVRTATRTLVMVVGCYFIPNFAATIVNLWEYFVPQALGRRHYYAYLLAVDTAYLLMILGCAFRLPIYVINDQRIKKAILRAFIRRYGRFRGFKSVKMGNLEKWSIVVVSNSLRSNITVTNALQGSQVYAKFLIVKTLKKINFQLLNTNPCILQELHPGMYRKSLDELALLLQNRRRFLVDMTITLTTSVRKATPDESTTGEMTFLTDIQEEEAEPTEDISTTNNQNEQASLLLLPKWTFWEATV
uniref:G_PROTEIN_RECEP_F1_2 domain-containing protein n=1 Tax=Syphacia muris TaxID=451379 RepID=A0A0N5AZH0_9BILA